MAYNSDKGTQTFGDINYEGDPAETQIDFEDDLIALKTNNIQRLIVSSSAITASVIFSASAGVYAGAFYGDGSGLTSTAAGSTTQLQYNNVGAMAGSSNLTFNGITLTGSMTGSLAEFGTVVTSTLVADGNTTLGNASGDSVTINAATVDIPNVAAGTDNTVIIYNGSTLLTDEIDSRVWGSTLVDASGTPVTNQIARWSDADTVQGLTTLTYNGTVLAVTGNIDASINISASAFYGDATNMTGLPVAAISNYNNAADNRVITSVDAGTVQGEANLTFNGTTLEVLGDISGSGVLTIAALTSSQNSYFGANVGIGTDTPLYDLHVNGAGATVTTIDAGASSDAFLRFATNGTLKSYVKQGSGGNLIMLNEGTGGSVLLKASPGGVETTYITLDGGTTEVVSAVNTVVQGGTHLSGSVRSMYTFKTTDYTLTSTDHIAIFNASSPSTATLPLVGASLNGVTYTVKSIGTANITVTGSAGVDQFIDGGQTFTVEQGDAVTLLGFAVASGFEWAVVNFYNYA